MKRPPVLFFLIATLMILGGSACASPTIQPTALVLPTVAPTQQLPTATIAVLPTQIVNTQPAVLPTSSAPSPASPSTVPTQPPPPLPLAVVLVEPNDVLYVRSSADVNSPVVAELKFDQTGLIAKGSILDADGKQWYNLTLPDGKTGWANATYLSEAVSPEKFCADTRVDTLVQQLTEAVNNGNGDLLASLVSPTHGLSLEYLRGGTVVNYTPDKAKWLFKSTYEINWGLHPGSGLPVKGTFTKDVVPALQDVLNNNYTRTCEQLSTGGATYVPAWPKSYQNINLLSLYRPGPAGQEQNWRTWIVGVEYVQDQPYLFALHQLIWEP